MILGIGGPPGLLGRGSAALLEREFELERIDAALTSAVEGRGVVVVIEGSAGIGKTALLRAARERAQERELGILCARGTELESDYPFGVVRQCLEPAARAAGAAEQERLLAGAAGLAAPVLLEAPGEQPNASFGVLYGLYWFLANLAERSALAVIVDDVQCADEPSLRYLGFLARRVESLPVAVMVALRTGEEFAGELADVRADPASEVIAPAPLVAASVSRLLEACGGAPVDPAFTRVCYRATAGNPFLVVELLRTLREEAVPFTAEGAERVAALAPREVSRRVQARLARFAPAVRALAYAAAVLDDGTPVELGAALAELDPASAGDAAEGLADAGVLEPGRVLRFCHPLLRAAVLDGFGRRERDCAHRRAAVLLRAHGAPLEQVAAQILAHGHGLGREDVETLRAAARRACERGAPDAAVSLLCRALAGAVERDERGAVLFELGCAERTAARLVDAAEHLRAAAVIAPVPIDRARAVAALGTVVQPYREDYAATLVLLVDAALRDLGDAERELKVSLETMRLLVSTVVDSRPDPQVVSIAQRLARLPGETPAECAALAQLADHRWRCGASAAEVGELSERATYHAGVLLEAGVDTAPIYFMLETLRASDRLDAAERIAERGIEIARRRGAARSLGAAFGHRALIQSTRGRLREAEADARSATEISLSDEIARVMTRMTLASCLLDADDLHGAEQAYAATGLREQVPDIFPFTWCLCARMRLRQARGHHAAALADFKEARRRYGFADAKGPLVGHYLVAVASHHALGHSEEAADVLARAAAMADNWGTPTAIGEVLRVKGRLAEEAEAIEHLAEAATVLERSPARLEHARALVELGAALRRAGHRRDAREPLREGHELARACGAHTLVDTARAELAASGVRVRATALTGPDSLTPSERRIADMAAAGATNAQIAQALFVTVKTVEMHLSNAYRKLAITKRTELAATLDGR
jgi:DNA-binding CsgD family transcriptional regulator